MGHTAMHGIEPLYRLLQEYNGVILIQLTNNTAS
jgi:hypothetical protein